MPVSLNKYHLRFVKEEDTEAILHIYKPFILNTAVTFEVEIPSLDAFSARIQAIQTAHPYLVAEYDGDVIGYAYSSAHRGRISYQWSKELSVYLHPDHRGKGLGRLLYEKLMKIVKWQGVMTALAGITVPNEKSVRFHTKMGFEWVGTYPRIGYKDGQWHDVSWFSIILDDRDIAPIDTLRDYKLFEKEE